MPKIIAFVVISLFFGTGFGFLLAVSSGSSLEGHDHGSHDHGVGIEADHYADAVQAHHHGTMIDWPADGPPPQLDMKLHAEPGGWNLQILTENFRFAPEHVNQANVPGEGHAHVYVDDVKIARIYGHWYHIGSLPEGAQILTVTLNANDHSGLALDGVPLQVSCRLPDCLQSRSSSDQ